MQIKERINPYEHLKDTHEYAKLKKITFSSILVTKGSRVVLDVLLHEVIEGERITFEKLNARNGIYECIELAILHDHQLQRWNSRVPILHGVLKEVRTRNHYTHINPTNIIGDLYQRTLRSNI